MSTGHTAAWLLASRYLWAWTRFQTKLLGGRGLEVHDARIVSLYRCHAGTMLRVLGDEPWVYYKVSALKCGLQALQQHLQAPQASRPQLLRARVPVLAARPQSQNGACCRGAQGVPALSQRATLNAPAAPVCTQGGEQLQGALVQRAAPWRVLPKPTSSVPSGPTRTVPSLHCKALGPSVFPPLLPPLHCQVTIKSASREEQSFACSATDFILDAAQENGIDLPFSCTAGARPP